MGYLNALGTILKILQLITLQYENVSHHLTIVNDQAA